MNKIQFFLLLFFLASCGSQKPVVRYTSKPKGVSQKPVLQKQTEISKPKVVIVEKQVPVEIKVENEKSSKGSVILKATTQVKVTNEMILDYIKKYKTIAKTDMQKFGIPASITLAQGILESGCGTGPLSVQANNHFGIKCTSDWKGESIKHDDDSSQECFRKYNDPFESYNDHSKFLAFRPRYASLFNLNKKDFEAWAKGLKAAGYATDPGYPTKLIGLINRFQLNQFDDEVIEKKETQTINQDLVQEKEEESLIKNQARNTETHLVLKGDTLYSLSKKYNISIDLLKQKNNLSETGISLGQTLIIK